MTQLWLSAPCWWRFMLQEVATQNVALSPNRPRRSCFWSAVESWATPHGTLAATRAARTWRAVMTAWLACDQCPLPQPFSAGFIKTLQVSFPPRSSSITKPPASASIALLERLCYHISHWCASSHASSYSFLSLHRFITQLLQAYLTVKTERTWQKFVLHSETLRTPKQSMWRSFQVRTRTHRWSELVGWFSFLLSDIWTVVWEECLIKLFWFFFFYS